jgi:hypothetical protein
MNISAVPASDFVFPGYIPIEPEATLDQLTGRFRAVRDGLPEIVKNSKDQYSRLRVHDREQRQIVVVANTKTRCLGVLDFAGAPAANYVGWATWSNPKAGQADLAADIEAGHGNGGKAFMVRGAAERAYMESCYLGKRTKMGFDNTRTDARYQPGFMTADGIALNDVTEPDPCARLDDFLHELGVAFEDLPKAARRAFDEREAFTGVFLTRVDEWVPRRQPTLRRIPEEISEIIASHGQAAMTIETCDVWVLVDGKVVSGSPIRPLALDPYPGFDTPREFVIPDLLPDPETGENVVVPGTERVLRLHTTAQQLQIRTETRAKNVIRVWNERNNVATWPLNGLGVLITSVSFIYGELRSSALTAEHQTGADRLDLAPTPLARALKKWTRDRVADLAVELNKAMAAATKPKEREHASNALNQFRDLMRKFLDKDAAGGDDDDQDEDGAHGDSGAGKKTTRQPVEFGTRVDQIVLELGSGDMLVAVGTTIPLNYQVLEVQGDGTTKPVRGSGLVVKMEPAGLVEADARGNLAAIAPGVVNIWLETASGEVRSNPKEVWAVAASGVDAALPEQPLLQGQKVKLGLMLHTSDGPVDDPLIQAQVIPPEMGKVGRHGRFTAGMHQGEATVRVRYGPNSSDHCDFVLSIGADRVAPTQGKGGKGADIPLILLCGEAAPGMEEYPEEARSIPPGPNYPTIVEDRALFPGIVWLNPNSKEAERVRTSVGSSSGVVGLETKTFTHFVALKCFEILKRLYIRQQIAGTTVTEDQYMQAAAYAELECADFIDAAWELSDQILKGGGSEYA